MSTSDDNNNQIDTQKHMERFLTGSAIGLTGMVISSLSKGLTGHKIGYGDIGLVNGFKVIFVSGLASVGVMKIAERVQ